MTNNNSQEKGLFALSNTVYDVAKDTATIYLPALGTLYFTLAAIWGLPAAEQVVATSAGLALFLGTVLKISTNTYNKSSRSKDGTLVIDQSDPVKDNYLFDLSTPLDEVADKNTITLNVNNTTPKSVMDQRLINNSDSQ